MKSVRIPLCALLPLGSAFAQTHIWEHKADGRFYGDCNGSDPGGASYWPNNTRWSQDLAIGSCNGVSGVVVEPSNWNVASFPNSPTAEVLINSGPEIDVDGYFSVGTLEIASGINLPLYGSSTIEAHQSITNNGTITIADLGPGSAVLKIDGNVTLNGTGEVIFGSEFNNQISSVNAADVLTIGNAQVIRTLANTTSIDSWIQCSIDNQGTISADQGDLKLFYNTKTNNGTMQAINGGTLLFTSTTVNNAGGTITAGPGSIVDFDAMTLAGGTLNGAGTFDVSGWASVFDGTSDPVAVNGTVEVNSYGKVQMKGGINHASTIWLQDPGSGYSEIEISGDVNLQGAGQVIFNGPNDNRVISVNPGDVLTIGPEQQWTTSADTDIDSRIITAIDNHGTITADQGLLRLDTNPKTNQGTLQATNGGTLLVQSININNTLGTITAGDLSTIDLNSATVTGGVLNGDGVFDISGTPSIFDGTTFPVNLVGKLEINSYGKLQLQGTLNNTSTIWIQDPGSGYSEIEVIGSASVLGAGEVIFNSQNDNRIISSNATDVLTIGPSQHWKTSADADPWDNRIIASIDNQGTISADTGGLTLDTHPKTNHGLMQATNGGTLRFSSTQLNNVSGQLTAGPGSIVDLNASTITGGVLNGSGSFEVINTTSTFDGSGSPLQFSGTADLGSYGILVLRGGVQNAGRINITAPSAGTGYLRIDGDVVLTGTGEVVFNSPNDNLIDSVDPADLLTIGTNQTLRTIAGTSPIYSRLVAKTVNEGTIHADGGGLQLDTHLKTNNSQISALNGGKVRIYNTSVDNTNGTITAETGSMVEIQNATLTGGTLDGDGSFSVVGATGNIIDSSAAPVIFDSTMELGTGDTLTVRGNLENRGVINLSDLASGITYLRLDGDVTLSGDGRVVFNSTEDNYIEGLDPAHVLTVGSSQLLTTSTDSRVDWSRLVAETINHGTIRADGGGLQLLTNPKRNHHRIEAINGGNLRIYNTTIDNRGATLFADHLSTVELSSATVSGGSLTATRVGEDRGTYHVISTAMLDGSVETITLDGDLEIDGSETLTLVGTVQNDGIIHVTDLSSSVAYLNIDGDVSLLGSGQVRLESNDDNWLDSADPTDVLTIGPDQELVADPSTLAGASHSRILTACDNQGTITVDGGGLQLDSHAKTNNGLIHTLDGGNLRVEGTSVDNSGGVISLDAAGILHLYNGTITGGAIDGDGAIIPLTGTDTLGDLSLGAGVTATIGTSRVLNLSGTVTNNGRIEINDNGGSIATLRADGPVSLLGSGQVVFNTYDDCYLDSTDPGDVLTVGPDQTLTTAATTLLGESRLICALVNQGTLEANVGSLSLYTHPKTNAGVFRAANGGTLQILGADTQLTNYAGGTLSGGRWEVLGDTAPAVIDLPGTTITQLAPGTEVVLRGMASIPQLASLTAIHGKLAMHDGQSFTTTGSLDVNGHLEFGLPDSGPTNWDTTKLVVDGDVDLTGAVIDIVDRGMTAGRYRLIEYNGFRTGTPTLGTLPAGFSYSLDTSVAGQIDLVSGGVSAFDEWKSSGSMGAVTFGGDTNGDGVQDGMAFLLGVANPDHDANGSLPEVSEDSSGNLVMAFRCLAIAERGTSVLNLSYDGDLAGAWLSVPVPGVIGAPNPVVESTPSGSVSFVATDGGTNANGDALIDIVATISDGTQSAGGQLFGRLEGTE